MAKSSNERIKKEISTAIKNGTKLSEETKKTFYKIYEISDNKIVNKLRKKSLRKRVI